MTENKSDELLNVGLVFIPKEDIDAHNGLFPDKWTTKQLRAMADYMEANPNCTLFDDGSGTPCT